jgi:hypothetical protein
MDHAHEGIGLFFVGDCRRDCGFATISLSLGPLDPAQNVGIVGLDVLCEFQILQSVLMPAKHFRIVRQVPQNVDQSGVHLLGGPFEKPAASGHKQSIPCNKNPISQVSTSVDDASTCEHCRRFPLSIDVVANVSRGVTRGEETLNVDVSN